MGRFEVVWGADSRYELPSQMGKAVPAGLPFRATAVKPRLDNWQAEPDRFVDQGFYEPSSDAPIDELLMGHCQIAILPAGMRTMLYPVQQPDYMYLP